MTTTTPRIASIVAENAVDLLQAFAKTGDWDLPPSVGFVIDTDEQTPYAVPLQMSEDLWNAAPPAAVLTMLAGAIRQGTIRIGASSESATASSIIGALVVVESWSISTEDWTEQQRLELEAWAQHNSLKDHPSGNVHELRIVTAIDSSGVIECVSHMRGHQPNRNLVPAQPGDIPDALQAIMRAVRETEGAVLTVDVE